MSTKNYINNNEFELLIIKYNLKTNSKEEEDKLFKLFNLLIDNIILTFNFKFTNSVDYDDAKSTCMLLIIKVIGNYSKNNGTAFNYFTQVIINSLKQLYTFEKQYKTKIDNYIKYKENIIKNSNVNDTYFYPERD